MRLSAAQLVLLTVIQAPAAEKWADPALAVPEGVILWIDAGRQPAARLALKKTPLRPGGPIDLALDGSGLGHHLSQLTPAARPKFAATGDRAAFRFDGSDDWLGVTRVGRSPETFSVFVVASVRSNAGFFRGLLAGSEAGRNDYNTGFTLDLDGAGSATLERVNVEGKGFGGASNLLKEARPFGTFHTFEAHGRADEVALLLDGVAQKTRPRKAGPLRFDVLTLGARYYSNTDEPACVSGFLDGDITEALLFDRVLSDAEAKAVRAYLMKKHAGLERDLRTVQGVPLKPVADPPPVQVFVPGFHARQLPVDLTNVNNLRYRPDGKLVALGYDGNVWLLSDTDKDGIEDKADLFWENKGRLRGTIGMALTPPGYKAGNGLFVAGKGKVSLLLDTDGDDRADKEVVVAQGWKELPHGVDALGVAVEKDGTVYFGLGTTDFTNAYQVKEGKARYDLKDERGTILKVSPDFTKREIVATGIRFPVGMAFNRDGDLFATDQEGATWLPNGNPLDELLHVLPGRHYGFPPRHPKHLPGVIDEPSVFDYAPQHQSTCGLVFNESVNGGPVFGPSGWAGDALVTGYSRGKLYRSQLVKTPAGYVARNHLFACLNMLTADCCVSPKGDLVVAVHSGAPDWGTGPTGKGKLYKISYVGKDLPQPLATWAAGPREVRVAFDRPLEPSLIAGLGDKAKIEHGAHVRPGDRFETLRPGYAVVHQQMAAPRFEVGVRAVAVSPDRRTLVLTTATHPEATGYALSLPGLGRPAKTDAKTEPPQHAMTDLGYDLGGVEAEWKEARGARSWSGWLPHPSAAVSKPFLAGSADHDALWPALESAGTLTLRTRLDLANMLRPAVQPGSTLDHTFPPEEVTLTFTARGPLTVTGPAGAVKAEEKDGKRVARLTVTPKPGELLPLEIVLTTGTGQSLEATWHTKDDSRERPFPLHRFVLPWAPQKRQAEEVVARPAELLGGSWTRGREVFFSNEAQCARCHSVRGQGGKIGADLSNLVHRDVVSVLRDIRTPSAALNPDFLTYRVELKSGKVLVGAVRGLGNKLIVGDANGQETAVARDQIDEMAASPTSIMPEGLEKAIGPDKMRDLLTFLLTEPLEPAPLERDGAPPARKKSEVDAVLKDAKAPARDARKIHVVLATGPKDHGKGEHDYPLFRRRWVELLSGADGVTVSEADSWPTAKQWEKANLVVFYSANPSWAEEKAKEMDAFLARGGGLVFVHFAVNGQKAPEALAERIGLAWKNGQSKFRHGALDLKLPDAKHPITRGLDTLKLEDESYWKLTGDPKKVTVLATGDEDGAAQPLIWSKETGKGRVFVSIPGHYTWTFDDPLFRIILLRGMAWAAGEDADRLLPLTLTGARIRD